MDNRAFARFLVQERLLRQEDAQRALGHLSRSGCRLDSLILLLKLMPESALLAALGRFSKSRSVPGQDLVFIPRHVVRLVPRRVAERFGVLPFRLEGRTLSVAALDPTDLLVEDELRLLTSNAIRSFAALEVRLLEGLAQAYGTPIPPALSGLVKPARRKVRRSASSVSSGARAAESTSHVQPPSPAERRPERRRVTEPEALELSTEDIGLFPTLARSGEPALPEPEVAPPGPPVEEPEDDREGRLEAASDALQRAEMRDDIGDALLAFCRPSLRRRALFVCRKDTVVGWRGEGDGVTTEVVRAVSIPMAEPSVFYAMLQGTEFWLGPLPPMRRNLEITLALGGDKPSECLVLPVKLRSRVVCFLYGDNGADGVRRVPLADLRRLVAKAGLAFEAYILRNKIRRL